MFSVEGFTIFRNAVEKGQNGTYDTWGLEDELWHKKYIIFKNTDTTVIPNTFDAIYW